VKSGNKTKQARKDQINQPRKRMTNRRGAKQAVRTRLPPSIRERRDERPSSRINGFGFSRFSSLFIHLLNCKVKDRQVIERSSFPLFKNLLSAFALPSSKVKQPFFTGWMELIITGP